MIYNNMRSYSYSTFGGYDSYGQPQITETPVGEVLLSIYLFNQSTADNILYKDANYTALTLDNKIDDTYIINFGEVQLKVLYVNPSGRYKQVFLKVI